MMLENEERNGILRVQKIRKVFSGFTIHDLDFCIRNGDICAIIGPNGAGKTTFFNLITGYLKPDSGRVIWKDQDITMLPPHAICRMGIARSFQVAALYPRITVFQNVQIALFSRYGKSTSMFSSSRKLFIKDTEEILEVAGLSDQADSLAYNLSHGDRKRLEFAMVLGNRPQMLLLDEPTAGMSSAETSDTMELVKKLNEKEGISILFTEHDMSVVFGIAKRIAVLHQGVIIADGTPQEVRSDDKVQKIYFGEESI